MNTRQAVLDAFQLKASSHTPATIFGGGVWTIRRWRKQFGELLNDPQQYARLIVEANRELASPIVYVGSGYNNYLAAALGGAIKERELGAPDLQEPIVKASADELDALDVAMIESDPWIQKLREATRLVANEIGDTHIVAVTAWGPFTLAGQIYGVEQFMRATYKKPADVQKTLEFATRLLKQFYRPMLEAKTMLMASIADPTASGDLISGRVFEKFDLPYLKDLDRWIKSYGAFVWLHICGNTTDKLHLIAQTEADCFSLDYKVNLAKAKEVLGGKMCIAGNVDPVSLLYNGTPESVAEASAKCLADAAAGGGFILTSGCDLPPTVKMENIEAMMNAAA